MSRALAAVGYVRFGATSRGHPSLHRWLGVVGCSTSDTFAVSGCFASPTNQFQNPWVLWRQCGI